MVGGLALVQVNPPAYNIVLGYSKPTLLNGNHLGIMDLRAK